MPYLSYLPERALFSTMTPQSEPSWVERAFTCEMLGRPQNSLESGGAWAYLDAQATCAEPFLPFDMEK